MRTTAADTRRRRRLLWAALLLALAGIGLAAELTALHGRAYAPGSGPSFCSIDPAFDCDAVARSRFAVFAGIPVSVWGLLGYGVMGLLAATGLRRKDPGGGWPAGVLLAVTGGAAALSVVLAVISEAVLRTICLLCMGAWGVNVALFAVSFALARASGGIRPALRADAAALRARPGAFAAVLLAIAVGVAVLATTYPRYWEAKRSAPMQWNESDASQVPLPVR